MKSEILDRINALREESRIVDNHLDPNAYFELWGEVESMIVDLESQLKDQEGKEPMRKGILTMAIPETSWLHPYIEYEVEFNKHIIIVDGDSYSNDNYLEKGYIKEHPQLFLLPTDEEIDSKFDQVYKDTDDIYYTESFKEGALWLKTKIKSIPKELSEVDLNEIKENEFALSYLPNDGIKSLYENIIQHFTEKE